MSQKTLATLQQEIDAAVHPGGGLPLITGADVRTVLTSLATEVAGAGAPPQIVDYEQVLGVVETAFDTTGKTGSCSFAVGDIVTQSGLGLYQCLQAFTVGFSSETQEFVNSQPPSQARAYWRQVQHRADELFVSLHDTSYRAARYTGQGGVVVADPGFLNQAISYGSAILGGRDTTVWSSLGAVVGGQHLTLPEGADNSVVLGGQDYAAPARPNTVFAPQLVLWQPGGPLELTDPEGVPHRLATANGLLTFDGLPLYNTPLVALTARSAPSATADPDSGVVPLVSFTEQWVSTQDVGYELRDGGFVVPVSGIYEVTARAVVDGGILTPTDIYSVGGGQYFELTYQVEAEGSVSRRNLTTSTARRILLTAGSVVKLFVSFSGTTAPVTGELGIYLLNKF